jgi:hypothetical protein
MHNFYWQYQAVTAVAPVSTKSHSLMQIELQDKILRWVVVI